MAETINLYPPILDTFMPAFLINSSTASKNICRVYFSLSQFNTLGQIKNVQIAVRNSSTNLSALNPELYPSEIMIKNLLTDETRTTDDKYYIEIEPTDMINENFIIDQYYRVQLRFTDKDATDPVLTPTQAIDTWLVANSQYFSEWSTVCLIRGISVPSLSLTNFNDQGEITIQSTIAHTQIAGSLTFADEDETETLKSYRIILYDDENTQLLDSGNIYTSEYTSTNEINYTFNYDFKEDETYHFSLEYTTANLYTESNNYTINVEPGTEVDLHIVCRAWTDPENGCIKLKILRSKSHGDYTGQIIIRRTDGKSNFTIWEDIFTYNFIDAPSISKEWRDFTIESGMLYKYAIQSVTEGVRAPMTIFKNPILVELQHIYLVGKDRQLKLSFNPSISSIKQNISEVKIDTSGSKYPYVKRDGYLNYTDFPISGTINSLMDEDDTFINKEEIYGNKLKYYEDYNGEHNVTSYNDYVYEKFFRDKVREFLNNSEAKLFRSPTEGNYLVRLMNINYTPNRTLGRNVWDFSCSAYEIDECTTDNYEKYGIISRTEEG